MLQSGRAWLLTLTLTMTGLAGCVTPPTVETASTLPDLGATLDGVLPIRVENLMSFAMSVVTPAVGTFNDLYEPTMEVSDTGTIYVAGHVVLAATTGTPAYFSTDEGKTWKQLPFVASASLPAPIQGSQPPPGDEGFIVAGADGSAWMADIYAAGFTITGWCDDGARQCYDNRQAFDRVESTTGCNPTLVGFGPVGVQGSLNDRPWAAYANGSLLLVNNPGGGPVQLGIMDVPPAGPVGVATVNGPTWNSCGSEGGWIPGIPAMRDDGLFAIPQLAGEDYANLTVVIGNKADIFALETKLVFPVTSAGPGASNYGHAAFDKEGTLFIGARNNTVENESEPGMIPFIGGMAATPGEGRIVLAVSTDDGTTFQNATFSTGAPVQSLYLDGNMAGPGALVVWSTKGEGAGLADWFVGHVFVGADGRPTLQNVTLAVDEGPPYSAHVIGAAAGPDGRAYFLNFEDKDPVSYVGSTPIRVWIQQEGPTLPVTMPVAAASE